MTFKLQLLPPVLAIVYSLGHVWLFWDPMVCSLPGFSLFIGFSRQENWSRLLFPPPGDFPTPGIKPASLNLRVSCTAGRFFTTEPLRKSLFPLTFWLVSSCTLILRIFKTLQDILLFVQLTFIYIWPNICPFLCSLSFVPFLMSRECMLLGSLSRHNKNLEWWTLKAPGGSQLSEDRPCYSSQVSNGLCYCS